MNIMWWEMHTVWMRSISQDIIDYQTIYFAVLKICKSNSNDLYLKIVYDTKVFVQMDGTKSIEYWVKSVNTMKAFDAIYSCLM